MAIKPLGDRVLIEVIEEDLQKQGSIYIPDTAKEKPMRGRIVAVGSGKLDENGKRVALEVKVKDVVLYGKYSGTEIKIEGEDYLIMRESDVLAIVEG